MIKVFKVASDKLNKVNDITINGISEHLTGSNHSFHHKFFTGFGIMIIGVCFAKLGSGVIHIICDLVGYGLHAIGMIPLADIVSKYWQERNNKKDVEDGK